MSNREPVEARNLLNLTIIPYIKDNNQDSSKFQLKLKERYKIIKSIGEGNAGIVLLALDLDILRLVALKKMKVTHKNRGAILNFINEIRVVGHLEHPNIVPIHDVGRDRDGYYYFIMKYSPGETLEDIISRLQAGDSQTHIAYPIYKRVLIFQEILKAISFAHSNNIIHRDIKPSNILIGEHNEVTVMDWGIATFIGNINETPSNSTIDKLEEEMESFDKYITSERDRNSQKDGTVIGTLKYMAPEQASGKVAYHDEGTDIYALSALFYEFISLKPYLDFPKDDIVTTLEAINTTKPKHLLFIKHKYQKTAPADLSHFIMKGLNKKHEDRYQSVIEMERLLEKIQIGEAPIQCPFTLSKRVTTSVVHLIDSSSMWALVAFMALLVVIIYGLYAIINLYI